MSETVRPRLRRAAPALLLLALAGPASAQIKEAAELLPAETLAYVELRQPERLSREVTALLKGSVLNNLPAALAKFRARQSDNDRYWYSDNVAMYATMFAPEMVAEAGRLRGALFAVTGMGKDGPEMVGIVLNGSSHAPTFFLRVILASDRNIRSRGEVAGVTLYRARRRIWRKQDYRKGEPPPPAQPPMYEDSGPTYALLPGAIVIGTENSVKDVVRRAKGKNAGAALSSVRAYKESMKLRQQPGLFAYGDLAMLASQIDQTYKGKSSRSGREWKAFKEVYKPGAFRGVAASLSLVGGELALDARVHLDPKESSPLLDLLPNRKADVSLLHFVPKDATLSFSMSLPEGAARWRKLLTGLDSFAKLVGISESEYPSKTVAKAEKSLKFHLGKEVFGKIGGLGVVFDMHGVVPEGAERMPTLVVSATSMEAAKFLEETALPKLVAVLSGREVGAPRQQGGISALTHGLRPLGKVLYYGRKGKVLVLGQDAKRVGAMLAAGGRKAGVLADKQVAAALKAVDAPIVVGVASLGQALVGLLREEETPRNGNSYGKKGGFADKGRPPQAPSPKPVTFEKYVKELTKTVASMSPGVLSLTRKSDLLTLQFRQPELRTHSAKLIDIWIEAALERTVRESRERYKRYNSPRQYYKEKSSDKEKPISPKDARLDKKP